MRRGYVWFGFEQSKGMGTNPKAGQTGNRMARRSPGRAGSHRLGGQSLAGGRRPKALKPYHMRRPINCQINNYKRMGSQQKRRRISSGDRFEPH